MGKPGQLQFGLLAHIHQLDLLTLRQPPLQFPGADRLGWVRRASARLGGGHGGAGVGWTAGWSHPEEAA